MIKKLFEAMIFRTVKKPSHNQVDDQQKCVTMDGAQRSGDLTFYELNVYTLNNRARVLKWLRS